MDISIGETRLLLKTGDLAREEADALVNAANSSLEPGGGVCGALHAAAGPALAAACAKHRQEHGQCTVGDAILTEAGDLKAKHVIHAVGPVWHDGQRGENVQLERAWQRALVVAREAGARTVAFPAISTGIYAFPKEPAAYIAFSTIGREVMANPDAFDEIRIVLFDDETRETFAKVLAEFERTMLG